MQHHHQQQEACPLLATLHHLDGTWRDALLPLLRVQCSTSNLALTCRALRELRQSTQQRLCFGSYGMCDGALSAFVPERFPACTAVHFDVGSNEDAVNALPALFPSLGRLPAQSQLTLNLYGAIDGHVIALVLHLVRVQLPQLRQLKLTIASGGWSTKASVWRALGSMVQLSSLVLELNETGVSLEHMSALSALTALQHLAVKNIRHAAGPQHHGYLASLGGLTHLAVPLLSVDGLAAIGACSNLRHLELAAKYGPGVQLDDAACASLQRLVQLTRLKLLNTGGTDSPAFASALRGLRQLEQLDVPATSHATLAALAGLSRLTSLQSEWVPGDAAAATGAQPAAVAVCASVRDVDLWGAGIPWRAFPGVTFIRQRATWAPADFIAISSHCRQLTQLVWYSDDGRCMEGSAPLAERVAAIRSLAALARMRQLTWTVSDNAELAALADVSTLTCLTVWHGGEANECTVAGVLCLLASSRSLVRLSVYLVDLLDEQLRPADATALLCSCRHLRELHLSVDQQQHDVLQAALHATKAGGLALPASVTFAVLSWP